MFFSHFKDLFWWYFTTFWVLWCQFEYFVKKSVENGGPLCCYIIWHANFRNYAKVAESLWLFSHSVLWVLDLLGNAFLLTSEFQLLISVFVAMERYCYYRELYETIDILSCFFFFASDWEFVLQHDCPKENTPELWWWLSQNCRSAKSFFHTSH